VPITYRPSIYSTKPRRNPFEKDGPYDEVRTQFEPSRKTIVAADAEHAISPQTGWQAKRNAKQVVAEVVEEAAMRSLDGLEDESVDEIEGRCCKEDWIANILEAAGHIYLQSMAERLVEDQDDICGDQRADNDHDSAPDQNSKRWFRFIFVMFGHAVVFLVT